MKPLANKLTPLVPSHPGELLKDEIEFRGLSQRKLAAEMEVSYTVLNEILNGKRPVNVEFALLIEAALKIDASLLINMQTRYNLQTMRQNANFAHRMETVSRKMTISLT